tara:strand:- start:86936 stop:87679 length:744 start_codon:yes stop_codon:yes gene_type:complete
MTNKLNETKTYVLIHGAWGAAWEFDEVKELLSKDGSTVHALDLPGHGENKKEIVEVTMDAYVQHIEDFINKIDGKVILVGHSLGGAIISQVAEGNFEKIEKLIYVAAMLPKNGDSPLGLMQSDKYGQLLPRIIFSEDQSYATLDDEMIRDLLLHDVADEARLDKIVPEFLVKQAIEPFTVPAQITAGKFGSVPKYYIRASLDKVLTPELQDKMIGNWDVEKVFTLNSGHFPITSVADNLTEVIREIG